MKSLIDHNEGLLSQARWNKVPLPVMAARYYHFFLLGLHICVVDRKKHPYVLFSKRVKERKFFKYGITISNYNPK